MILPLHPRRRPRDVQTQARWHAEIAACCALWLIACASSARAQPYAYVANLGSDNVSVIDVADLRVVATIAVGQQPDGVAVSADGTRAYVSNFASHNISIIDTATQDVVATVDVGQGPVGLAVTADGRRVVVANRREDTVSIIDTVRNRVAATVAVDRGPDAVAITADGARAYVTNSSSTSPGVVSVVDVGRGRESDRINVVRNPNRVAIAPDGRTAYVTNFRAWNVSVIATATDTVSETIRVEGKPVAVAFNPNGAFAYVVGKHGDVSVIDVVQQRVVEWLQPSSRNEGIGITHDGATAFITNFDAGSVNVVDLTDLANIAVVATVPVGDKPFAIAANCIGRACNGPPFTPKPTATLTPAPTNSPEPTLPPLPPTSTPLGADNPVVLAANVVTGRPGEMIRFTVTLDSHGLRVAGTENDLHISDRVVDATSLRCRVNPSINRTATAFARLPCDGCVTVRALVISFEDLSPIPDGSVLYTCTATIAASARAGPYPITLDNVGAADPDGRIVVATVSSGQIEVLRMTAERAIGTGDEPTTPYMCIGGERDGLACDAGCQRYYCGHGAGVCDGGDDDGLLCDCYGGRCDTSGRCVGGLSDRLACDPDTNCAGEHACLGTTKLCDAGPTQGTACLSDQHCMGSACVVPVSICQGGPLFDYTCIDASDCPEGPCVVFNAPASIDDPIKRHADSADGCTVGRSQSSPASAAILGLVVLLVGRTRTRARTTMGSRHGRHP